MQNTNYIIDINWRTFLFFINHTLIHMVRKLSGFYENSMTVKNWVFDIWMNSFSRRLLLILFVVLMTSVGSLLCVEKREKNVKTELKTNWEVHTYVELCMFLFMNDVQFFFLSVFFSQQRNHKRWSFIAFSHSDGKFVDWFHGWFQSNSVFIKKCFTVERILCDLKVNIAYIHIESANDYQRGMRRLFQAIILMLYFGNNLSRRQTLQKRWIMRFYRLMVWSIAHLSIYK